LKLRCREPGDAKVSRRVREGGCGHSCPTQVGKGDTILPYGQDFISGIRAEDVASQGLATTTGTFIITMPLPYSTGNGGAAWIVPIYFTDAIKDKDGNLKIDPQTNTLLLDSVRMVNALDYSKVASVAVREGYTGAALVHELRMRYDALTGTSTSEGVQINATVTGVSSYTSGGQTHLVIRTDNTEYSYIEATPTTLSSDQWQKALFLKTGDKFTATVSKVGNTWTATSITID